MDLSIRRIILVVVSIAAGLGMSFGGLVLIGVTFESYTSESPLYFVFTAFPLAVLVGIWLDYFLKTRLLSEGPAEEAAAPAHDTPAE
jgi:hypothetical protein